MMPMPRLALVDGSSANLSLTLSLHRTLLTPATQILDHLFFEELKIDRAEIHHHPILVTEPPRNPKPQREKLMRLLFDTYNFAAMCVGFGLFSRLLSMEFCGSPWHTVKVDEVSVPTYSTTPREQSGSSVPASPSHPPAELAPRYTSSIAVTLESQRCNSPPGTVITLPCGAFVAPPGNGAQVRLARTPST